MTTPVSLIQGPKAMIINEYAGSGGDAMPWYFRAAARSAFLIPTWSTRAMAPSWGSPR